MATDGCPPTGRLFVTDRRSNTRFLVDTGSDVCVYPRAALRERRQKTNFVLSAANGSDIETYGFIDLCLDLDLRRNYQWRFTVVNVTKPIIGVDFLSHYNLVVDCKNHRLIDNTTTLSCIASSANNDVCSVKILTGSSCFHAILDMYPEITRPSGTHYTPKHNTVHHIRTTPGPPISCTTRRLAPDKMKIAKQQFELMLSNGTARPSESSWSSPLRVSKSSQPVDITGEALTAFNKCKESLANAALLAHPDCQADLALVTDASDLAMGAVLQQLKDG
ncbi:PREDICTED: uncharacterized protein LOC106110674, partial [Papilio polytes]|uniref:uncharacterized protein LOC106110674 n=1 Tax=Papilio polytes TaxID=76194 RepID=UPI00067636A1